MRNYLLRLLIPLLISLSFTSCKPDQRPLLESLLADRGGIVSEVYQAAEKHELQILYTQIDRDENNQPTFTSHTYRLDGAQYFYPASTVKFPAAILALEKLKQLGIDGLNAKTPMLTDSAFSGQSIAHVDSSAENMLPSVGHYIKKILLVSDNDAFNRLYEFLGQGPLNESLSNRGYEGVKISHRLSIFLSEEENRHTNPIRFLSEDNLLYEQEPGYNENGLPKSMPILRGKGEMIGGEFVSNPKDFASKNAFPLLAQQQILKDVLFPNSVLDNSGFDLDPSDREFLWKYMSMLPGESSYPAYDDSIYYDGYCKFFLFGDTKEAMPESIRIFNKVGNAYGYLTDNAYIIDFEKGIEFMLTATVYVNENQIFNDNHYEYDEKGYPFMADLGRMLYEYEENRPKKRKPDLSEYRLRYN